MPELTKLTNDLITLTTLLLSMLLCAWLLFEVKIFRIGYRWQLIVIILAIDIFIAVQAFLTPFPGIGFANNNPAGKLLFFLVVSCFVILVWLYNREHPWVIKLLWRGIDLNRAYKYLDSMRIKNVTLRLENGSRSLLIIDPGTSGNHLGGTIRVLPEGKRVLLIRLTPTPSDLSRLADVIKRLLRLPKNMVVTVGNDYTGGLE